MTMSPSRAGIFDVLLRLVRTGLGGKAASGEQFISWIHYVDFLAAIDFLIAHPGLGWTREPLLAQSAPKQRFHGRIAPRVGNAHWACRPPNGCSR